MKIRKIIDRRIRHSADGVDVVGDVQGVISANVNEPGGSSHVSSSQRQRIVQRGGKTVVSEESDEGGASAEPRRES
jgi:hypothetical protein